MPIESLAPNADYDSDLVAWSERQAALARARKLHALDLMNLAEELEDMGRRERRALESHLTRLLMHLLKWRYQPERRTGSWHLTIREARRQIRRILQDSPSLVPYLESVFNECYQEARGDAAAETGLAIEAFPTQSPDTPSEVLAPGFLPA
jgi:hypothetical protein